MSYQDIIDQYIDICSILRETTLNGDYKRGNKEGKKIIEVYKFSENNLDVAKVSLPALFTHDNVVTRTKAAAHCISLNIFVDEAIRILENAANDKSNGIFGFNAEMTLKVWREQRYLKVYPKQQVIKSIVRQ